MYTIGMNIVESQVDGRLDIFAQDLEQFRNMGIEAVEIPVHGLDAILNGDLNQSRLTRILNILKHYDFKYSVHSPNPINLMDQNDPGLHADVLSASLEFARQVGAGVVVLHPGRFIPEESFGIYPIRSLCEADKQQMLDQEAAILTGIAREYPDVMIALENSRPYLSQSPYCYAESLDALKKQVLRINMKNVRITLDFGHLFMAAHFYQFDPVEKVHAIKNLLAHTHIHDNFGALTHHFEKNQTFQLPFGKGDSHMPVGWGGIPVDKILKAILPDYQGLFMMELRGRYFNHIQESKKNLSALLDACLRQMAN